MPESEKRGPFKRLLDSRLAWDAFGPLYNRRISILLADVYEIVLSDVEPPKPDARILDVGCGPGILTVMLALRYPDSQVVGIDYSTTEVRAAKKSASRKGVTNCRILRADAMDLPFDDESFEQVVSTFCIKHWPDRQLGMNEIRRVLVPRGRAFLTEFHKDYTEEEYERGYEKVEAVFGRYLSALPTTPRGVRWAVSQGLSLDEAIGIARSAGFSEVEASGIEGWPFMRLVLRK